MDQTFSFQLLIRKELLVCGNRDISTSACQMTGWARILIHYKWNIWQNHLSSQWHISYLILGSVLNASQNYILLCRLKNYLQFAVEIYIYIISLPPPPPIIIIIRGFLYNWILPDKTSFLLSFQTYQGSFEPANFTLNVASVVPSSCMHSGLFL
jgi:hypothetical protein